MIVERVREYVQLACQSERNIFGPSFFEEHLVVVAECAGDLAERLRADPEIVRLAAYLHDLSAVHDPSTIADHARISADLARRLLSEFGYSDERAGAVARSIASHSSPLPLESASPEEVCISNADSLARILRPAYWLYFAFEIRRLPFDQGRQWLRSLFGSQYGCLVEPAKEFVGERYAATMAFLGPSAEWHGLQPVSFSSLK